MRINTGVVSLALCFAVAVACTTARANYLLMRGDTMLANTLSGFVVSPTGDILRLDIIRRELSSTIVKPQDVLIIDITRAIITVYDNTTPAELLSKDPIFIRYGLSGDVFVYDGGIQFVRGATAEQLSAPGNVILFADVILPRDPNKVIDGELRDQDFDDVADVVDNCVVVANPDQTNSDADTQGDLCDLDDDNDGISDFNEINLYFTNPILADTDGDGISDSDELFTHMTSPLLADTDGDGTPDGLEIADADGDPLDPGVFPGSVVLVSLTQGLNLVSFPGSYPNGIDSCFDVLAFVGGESMQPKVSKTEANSGVGSSCTYTGGVETGVDFPLAVGDGIFVELGGEATFDLMGSTFTCPTLQFQPGAWLIGVPSPAPDLSCFGLLDLLGSQHASAVEKLNPLSKSFQACSFDGVGPTGEDFPIERGMGLIVHATSASPALNLNDTNNLIRCPIEE